MAHNHSNMTFMSRDMRFSTFLAAILDLCKLGGDSVAENF